VAGGRQDRSEQRNIARADALPTQSNHPEIGERAFCFLRFHEFAQQCRHHVAERYPLILQCVQHAVDADAAGIRDEKAGPVQQCGKDISDADDCSGRAEKDDAIIGIEVA
jgi:hypothetical protein